MVEFEKLEKLEFGGSKGKILNDQIYRLNEEFMESCKIFTERTYNPLDYNNVVILQLIYFLSLIKLSSS